MKIQNIFFFLGGGSGWGVGLRGVRLDVNVGLNVCENFTKKLGVGGLVGGEGLGLGGVSGWM